MMQLRMSLATDNDTPKTAMLAPCEFKEQLAIKITWVKRFMVNLKALYKLGSMTTTSTGERNAFKFGWSLMIARGIIKKRPVLAHWQSLHSVMICC